MILSHCVILSHMCDSVTHEGLITENYFGRTENYFGGTESYIGGTENYFGGTMV